MMLLLLVFLSSSMTMVWSQTDLYCPAEDWQLDSTITLVCSVPKADYPSKCTNDIEINMAEINKLGYQQCQLTNFRTSCTAVGLGCSDNTSSCQHNSTHYVLHRTLTMDTDVSGGTWRCVIRCLTSSFEDALTYTQHNCEDREVVAYAVLSTPTRTVTRGSDQWTVRGSVDITRIFSSDSDLYSCLWENKRDGGSYTTISDTGLTFNPTVSGATVRTGQCSFPDRPLPSVDGDYTYRVTVSPGQTTATTTLTIGTPPRPTISCIPSSGYVMETRSIDCTCTGMVGSPEGRLQWFLESDSGDMSVKIGVYGDTTLELTLTVNRGHHGNKLQCDVDWATDVTGPDHELLVAYPPSTPTIIRTDFDPRLDLDPPIEGDTVTLDCSLTSAGNPPARLTWPSEEGSKVEVNPLVLTLTKGDHLRNVTCQASNEFTEETGMELTSFFSTPVYYGPYIILRAGVNNNCEMTSDKTSCHVTEGHRVHITCDVESNPGPKDCTWTKVLGSGQSLDLGIGPDLDLMGVNRSDSGMYQVHVQTEKPDSGDGRLPLEAHKNLIVWVNLQSESDEDDPSAIIGIGVALGITLVVVIVIIIVFFLWMWRRHWILPCAGKGRGQHTSGDNRQRLEATEDGPPPVFPRQDEEVYEIAMQRLSSQSQDHQSPHTYSSLDTGDIGVPSVYTAMSPYRDAAPTIDQGPDYEISEVEKQTTYENVICP